MNRARGRTLTLPCVSVGAADVDIAVKGVDYRIVVRGELDARFSYLFNGMAVERHEGTTVLEGQARDRDTAGRIHRSNPGARLHGADCRSAEKGS